ncbi:murein biosynthesis integral membrane protein MurJ [Pseudactinotalea sp. Z1732]|uniref:murein biosynthesis integral membrane protein MurJ n=1 Tax=Pseudactinotalea sp. Z1732 TaxID=3413026 RepID=UPI003C7D5807
MSRRGGLAGSAAVMFAGTLTSRVLGLVRSALLIAAIYTLGGAADSFAVANKIPNIIYMLIAGGVLNAVLVPQIVRAMRQHDGGQDYVNRLLTLAGTVLAVVTVLLTLAAPVLVTLYAAEFRSGPWASVAVAFAMWCLPQLFFYGMYTLLGQVLNARSVFGPYMWAPAVNNLFAIIGLIIYLVVFGSFDPADPDPAAAFTAGRIALLAGSATLGVVAQAAILVIPLTRSGFKFRFRWGIRGSGLGSAGRVAWWAFLALLAGQVGFLAISNLAAAASTAAEQAGTYAAGNAAHDAAFLVFMLPQSLITVSLVTAIFTRLSANAAAGDATQVREDLSMGLRTLGVFTVFAAGALAVLAIPVIQVVQFDVATFEAYQAVGAVLVAMVIGLPAIAIWTMTQRVYFAYEDTKALFFFQIPMALIQIVGCVLAYLLLPVHWWVVGSAVANSVSLMFGALVSYLALRRKLRTLDGARILRTYVRLTLALIIPTGVGWGLVHLWGVQTNFAGALLRVLVLGTLMALLYFIALRRLRVSELDDLMVRIGTLAAPLTTRVAPLMARIPGSSGMRTIWGRITGVDNGRATQMTVPAAASLKAGDVLAGRYRLISPQEGAEGWLGADTILDKQVYISTVAGTHREAALDGARRAALVADDRLLRILRVGTHEGTGFIVTEILQGRSLAELVGAGRVDPDQARTLIGEAAAALEVARRRGVRHLRLGPESLYRTPSGQVLVTGLAIDAAAAGVSAESAREAARTDTVDLVALLYTALTGHWPGAADLAGTVPLAQRYNDQPVPPAELLQGIPDDLDTLCAVTFGPHRDGPFTPGELVRDLAPWTEPGEGRVHLPGPAAGPHDTGAAGAADEAGGTVLAGVGVAGVAGSAAAAAGAGQHDDDGGTGPGADRPDPTSAAGDGGPAEPRTFDTSRWAPQPPPPVGDLPEFEALIAPEEAPPAHVLDTYVARHERAAFEPHLQAAHPGGSPAGDTADPEALDSSGEASTSTWTGATALPRPDEPLTDLPPTADLPPGVYPPGSPAAGTPGAAAVTRGAAASAGGTGVSAAGAAAGGAGTGASGAKGALSAAAAGIGAGAASAGSAIGAASAATGKALRSFADKTAEMSRRFADSARELTGTWTSGSDAETDREGPWAARSEESWGDSAGAAGATARLSGQGSSGVQTQDQAAIYPVAHPTAPTGMEPPADFDDDYLWESQDETERFNPTPVVILTMIAAVVVAGTLALGTLREARTSFDPDDAARPAPVATPTEEEETTEPVEEETEEETEPEEETPEGPDPAVADVRSLDDNPDLAYLAADGNPDTIWRSLRYNDPNYGMKPGLGFVIELEETAVVSRVTLDVQGEGGIVQIRAGDADNPDEGPVLAEGAMGPEVTYELSEPTETDVVVLWFPELPVADSDGRNRIELAEVSVR